MNHFKKSYKAIAKNFLQKILGYSSIMCVFIKKMCVFLSLKRRDNPIWCGTPCKLQGVPIVIGTRKIQGVPLNIGMGNDNVEEEMLAWKASNEN